MNSVIARIRSFMRGVRRPTQLDADMDEEMRFHIDLEAQRLTRTLDLHPREAQRRAAAAFGGVEKFKGAGRDERGITWVLGTSTDFRLGVRMLVKYPGLTAIGVFALAVAIGGGAAYLAFLNGAFRPDLSTSNGGPIVGIHNYDTAAGTIEHRSLRDFALWQRAATTVHHLGAFVPIERNLITPDGRVEPVRGVEISSAAFRIIPTPPLLGRPLVPDDEQPSAEDVVVIGNDVWQTRFAGDPNVIGTPLRLGDTTHTIVGVMPDEFGFPVNHRLWVPLRLNGLDVPRADGPAIRIFGQLADGTSMERAQAELTTISLADQGGLDGRAGQLRPQVKAYVDALLTANGEGPLEMLLLYSFNLFFLALLGVCGANVATLVFARTTTRENEITVRTALGASRGRIVAQMFAEALVLSLCAAALGLGMAALGLQFARDFALRTLQQTPPFWWSARITPDILLYAVALAFVAAAIIGIVPALKATSLQMQTRLRHAGTGNSSATFGRLWTGVIVGQVALTVLFLMSVVSLGWNAYAGKTAPRQYAFPREEFIAARVDVERPSRLSRQTDDTDFRMRVDRAFRALQQRLDAEPAIVGVTYATAVPGERHDEFFVELDGVTPSIEVDPLWIRATGVGSGFFETFGASITSGRGFTQADVAFERPVAIVDETFVATVMGGRDPVGLRIREPRNADNPAPGPWYEIVGVVSDLARAAQRTSEDAVIYRPARPRAAGTHVLIRVPSDASRVAAGLPALGADAEPLLRLSDVKRLDAADETDALFSAFLLSMLGIVSAVALLLSVAGVYALMSFTLARRTREIGIRAALGAAPRRIIAAIFSRAFAQVGFGLIAGSLPGVAIVAFGGGEVTRGGGASMGFAAALLISGFIVAVTALACAGPTRRALRIQPTEALRAER